MNVELLRKVKDHILAEPRRLDMCVVIKFRSGSIFDPPCGTVGCIAGWANYLEGRSRGGMQDAARSLGLGEEWQWLFFLAYWPENFCTRYVNAKTATTRAEVTAERIEHFIKTEGRE